MSGPITFEATLQPIHPERAELGIILTDDVLQHLWQGHRTRVEGEINGYPFNLSIRSTQDKIYYLIVGKVLQRRAKIKPGMFFMVCAAVVDPNKLDIPEELKTVLDLDEDAGKKYYGLTIGKQRSLAHYVHSASQSESRIKRALELAEKIKLGQLYTSKNEK